MPQMASWATFGALSIAGALAGVQLGRGAIDEVDPFFFTPLPETRFFADLVPAGYDPSTAPAILASDADEVWANNVNVSGRPECLDCRNFVENIDFAPASESVSSLAEAETAYVPPPAARRDYMPREVERYAYFPVTQEEAARPRRDRYAADADEHVETAEEPELLNM
jgi:hypothetical protein